MVMSSNEESEGIPNYCGQIFVIMDKWLNQQADKKGDKALKIVNDAIRNNIKANMTYYEGLAKAAQQNGQKDLASRNRLLARLYKGLLK